MILIHHVRHPLTDLPYIGTVVACEKDGKIHTAFSQCSPKDHYNRRIGRNIALERLKTGGGPSCAVPFIKFRLDGSKERFDVIGDAVKHIRVQAEAKFLNPVKVSPDGEQYYPEGDPEGFGGSDLGGRARGGPV